MRWILFVMAALAFAQPAAAAMKKCVDAKGRTYYYDRDPPPECAGKPTEELSKRGVVTKTIDGELTEEQRRDKELEAEKQKEEAQKMKDQQRRDKALLNTYSNEKEIDLTRDRNLQPVDLAIASAEPRLKTARAKLDGYRKQADDLAKANKPLPPYLKEDIAGAQQEVKRLEEEMAQKQKDRENIKAKFESDKQRYRDLTQKKP